MDCRSHSALVDDARRGRPWRELATAIPHVLLAAIGAIGSEAEITGRIAAFHDAGDVALVPAPAEDAAGRMLLASVGLGIV